MLNKVQLIGYVGKDPEIRKCQDGSDLMTFSVATTESYKDKSGEYKIVTDWHNIKLFRVSDYLKNNICKGRLVYIEGKIKTETFTSKMNEKRSITNIHALDIKLLGATTSAHTNANNLLTSKAPNNSSSFINDEIPF